MLRDASGRVGRELADALFAIVQLQHRGFGVPILRQLRQAGSGRIINRLLSPNGEMNPTVTLRATAGEACVVPPGTDQGIMNRTAMIFESEIDRLHVAAATCMRTKGVGIDYMRRHLSPASTCAIKIVHLLKFGIGSCACVRGFGHLQ
jgi:hypothetical protein